jgi:beta-lactamase regulating signal transducer with metallopeptidase domain
MKNLTNKKGQMGGGNVLAPVIGLIMGIVLLIFLVFAVFFGISTLNPAGFFGVTTSEYNSTMNIQKNLTAGVDTFTSYLPTMFKVLAIVAILGFIGMLIAAVVAFVAYRRSESYA